MAAQNSENEEVEKGGSGRRNGEARWYRVPVTELGSKEAPGAGPAFWTSASGHSGHQHLGILDISSKSLALLGLADTAVYRPGLHSSTAEGFRTVLTMKWRS